MPFLQRAGARVWWDERGEGSAVLLVQGLGYPSDMWHRLLPELARTHRVIVVDNRGVGRTGVPDGPATIEQMSGDAVAVLDAAGVERAHVVGVSMGGLIVQHLAVTHPERVMSLLLGCTHPGGSHAVFRQDTLDFLARRSEMTPDEAARASVPYVYGTRTPQQRIEDDLAIRRAIPTSAEGYLAQLTGAIGDPGTFERLPGLQMPTLVVHGSADPFVPPENGEKVAAQIPHARIEMIEEASHIFWTDEPERSRDLMLSWFDEQDQPST